MTTLFISDIHLDSSRPALTDILLRFLADQAKRAQALYLLGDVFETWIGDDATGELEDTVADALSALKRQGVALYFMAGNRDFLLGAEFAARCGMRRLPDPCVIDLFGSPTLLSHGDALCTGDAEYQAFRAQVRNSQWQSDFLARSIAERRAFAAQARAASASHQRTIATDIADVEGTAVDSLLRHYGIQRLIHGHTHRPATHRWMIDGREHERWVLADWRDAGEALQVTAEDICRIPLT